MAVLSDQLMPFTPEHLRLPKKYDDDKSLLPLLASPKSLRDLTEVIGYMPYIMVDPYI